MFLPAFFPVVPIEHNLPGQTPPGHHHSPFIQSGLVFPSISPALHLPPYAFVDHRQQHNNNPVLGLHLASAYSVFGSIPLIWALSTCPLRTHIAPTEEGLDTRTAVMIKYFPKKMAAKDLTQYISEVCTRRPSNEFQVW